MRLRYFYLALTGGTLLALVLPGAARAQAQRDAVATAPAADAPAPSPWLFKVGVAATHLRYDRTATSWQVLLPASFGVERRLSARCSLYGQLDTDCQLSSAARRSRSAGRVSTALPTVFVGAGGRLYYGQPAGVALPAPGRPELGGYLALEAGATLERTAPASRRAVGRTSLRPSLYALWGVQSRLRPHLLCDFSAGPGVLAPARLTGEPPLTNHGWDVGAQANIRLYWTR